MEKRLNKILRYFYQNKNSYFDIKTVCKILKIPFSPKYKIRLENDKYIENTAKSFDGDGFEITKQGEFFLEIEGGYGDKKKPKMSRTNRGLVNSFFKNNWVRTILGGIIVGLTLLFLNKLPFAQNITGFDTERGAEILIIPDNYKIIMHNGGFPSLDTLDIKYTYRGISAVINKDIKLSEYKFEHTLYFYKDPDFYYEPEIEILETFINNPILNSTNKTQTLQIQIRRKMVFDGIREAYFETNDKLQIGYLKLIAEYESRRKVKQDTLNVKIYLEK